MMRSRLAAFSALLVLACAAPALAAGHLAAPLPSSYVNLDIEAVRSTDAGTLPAASFTLDWGFMQGRFVGAGTRIGVTRELGDTGISGLLLGTGIFARIPLNEQLLVMPELTLGYVLSERSGTGLAIDLKAALAYLVAENVYVGLGAGVPVARQVTRLERVGNGFAEVAGVDLFPSMLSGNLLVGMAY